MVIFVHTLVDSSYNSYKNVLIYSNLPSSTLLSISALPHHQAFGDGAVSGSGEGVPRAGREEHKTPDTGDHVPAPEEVGPCCQH